MGSRRTIRNCLPVFRFACPKRWDDLIPGADPAVRHCSHCDRPVHFCATDADTIAHARAGDCIAREIATDSEPRRVYIGQPSLPPERPPTPDQVEVRRSIARERGIDDSIQSAATSTRECPACHYPAPDWRTTCRVCGFEMGRAVGRS